MTATMAFALQLHDVCVWCESIEGGSFLYAVLHAADFARRDTCADPDQLCCRESNLFGHMEIRVLVFV